MDIFYSLSDFSLLHIVSMDNYFYENKNSFVNKGFILSCVFLLFEQSLLNFENLVGIRKALFLNFIFKKIHLTYFLKYQMLQYRINLNYPRYNRLFSSINKSILKNHYQVLTGLQAIKDFKQF